jgi:flavin reductase (DIM6/NTAB) family NADH-FMN oxidoreductase RutF
MNAECRLVNEYSLGDHTMFVGEVVEASNNPDKEPLAYYNGKYWIMDRNVQKPSQEERERVRNIVEKFKKGV